MGEAFWSLADEPASTLRAVVLGGEGRAFCAGADIAWMRAAMTLSAEENVEDALGLADTLAAIDACPVPVVVRVQGAALGGGAGLCAVGDVVVAEAGARFGFPEVRLGLVGATISPFVVRRIGEGVTRALFASGELIDAAEARRIGLVHHVAEGEAALDATVDGSWPASWRAVRRPSGRRRRSCARWRLQLRRAGGDAPAGQRTAELLAQAAAGLCRGGGGPGRLRGADGVRRGRRRTTPRDTPPRPRAARDCREATLHREPRRDRSPDRDAAPSRLGIEPVLPRLDGPGAVDLLDPAAVTAAARASLADAVHPGLRVPRREPRPRGAVLASRPDVGRPVAGRHPLAGRQGRSARHRPQR